MINYEEDLKPEAVRVFGDEVEIFVGRESVVLYENHFKLNAALPCFNVACQYAPMAARAALKVLPTKVAKV